MSLELEVEAAIAGGGCASRFSNSISRGVKASVGRAFRVERFSIVSQKIRQPRTQNVASKLTSRSAVRSFDCSARQPDFIILWKVSIFQRMRVPVKLFYGAVA